MKYYPVSRESVRPDDLRSGITTEAVTIRTTPGRTNMSNEPRSEGWLGTTNDIAEYALGAFDTPDACRQYLRDHGYIPLAECCEAIRTDDTDDWNQADGETWYPAICRYEQIADQFGNNALSRWFQYGEDEIVARIRGGESIGEVAKDLEKEANGEGFTLVGLEEFLQNLVDAQEPE